MDLKSNLKLFKNFVRSKKLKFTRQREIVFKEVAKMKGHLSTNEVYDRIRKKYPYVGFSTIYRTLKLMEEGCFVARVSFDSKMDRYEYCFSSDHHDHLICLSCKEVIEFKNNEIEELQNKISVKYGFEIKDHRLDIFGICKNCLKTKYEK